MTYINGMEINYGIFSHLLLVIPKNKKKFFLPSSKRMHLTLYKLDEVIMTP